MKKLIIIIALLFAMTAYSQSIGATFHCDMVLFDNEEEYHSVKGSYIDFKFGDQSQLIKIKAENQITYFWKITEIEQIHVGTYEAYYFKAKNIDSDAVVEFYIFKERRLGIAIKTRNGVTSYLNSKFLE